MRLFRLQNGFIRRWRSVIRGTAAAIVLMLAGVAHGQAMPIFADPMTTPELTRYAKLLDLSDQQRLALEPMHDRYMDSFRRLRDGDIQDFQDHVLNMGMTFMRGGFQIPPREDLEKLITRTETIIGKIEAVDRSFFNEVATMLSESQQLKLPRVRTARTLALYKNVAMQAGGEFNRGASVNLTELVMKLELPPDQLANVEPLLASYDSGLVNRTRGVYNALKESAKYILDTIDELGLRQMTPEKMMALGQDENFIVSLQVRFDDGSKPFQDAVYQLSQLNMRTYRSMLPLLEQEHAAELRRRFYSSAFGRVYRGPGEWRMRYDKALQLKALRDETREQIQLQKENYVRQEDQLHDLLVSEFDDSQRYRTFAVLSRQAPDPHETKIDEIRKRLSSLNEAANTSLKALLGESLVATLDEPVQRVDISVADGPVVVQAGAVAGSGSVRSEVRVVGRSTADEIELPAALGVKDARQISQLLDISDDQRPVFDSLYDGYRAAYEQARQTVGEKEASPSTTKQQSISEGEEDIRLGEDEPPAQRMKRHLMALEAVDDLFFSDLALVVEGEAQERTVKRLRELRRRGTLGEASKNLGSTWGVTIGDEESYLDVMRIFAESDLAPQIFESMDGLWAEYESRCDALAKERFELAVAQRRRFDVYMKAASAGQERAATAATLHQKWREKRDAFRKANRTIATLNREFVERLASQLPDDEAWKVRFAFNRQAYPDLFRDSERIEGFVSRALELDSLTHEQRNRIARITQEFRERYFALSSSMVELRQKRDFDLGSFEMPDKSVIEREISLQRLEFDRDEITARTELRLRMALSSGQVEMIPGLRQ